jgi:hypothetical protein
MISVMLELALLGSKTSHAWCPPRVQQPRPLRGPGSGQLFRRCEWTLQDDRAVHPFCQLTCLCVVWLLRVQGSDFWDFYNVSMVMWCKMPHHQMMDLGYMGLHGGRTGQARAAAASILRFTEALMLS